MMILLDMRRTIEKEADVMTIYNITIEDTIMCCWRMLFSRAYYVTRCLCLHCCTPLYHA